MRTTLALLTLGLLLVCFTPLVGHAQGISVTSGLSVEHTLQPGTSCAGTLEVRNGSDTPQEARVYQTDLAYRGNGSVEFGEPGKQPRSNARWLVITPRQLTVPAKGTALFNYQMLVPVDANLKGSYWSMVMVEGIAPAALAPPKTTDEIVCGMSTVIRYAVQMITNIGTSGTCMLVFADKQIVTGEGKRFLQLVVANTGERDLRPKVWAELYDGQGVTQGRQEGDRRPRLHPGASLRYRMDLSALPPGKYTAMVVADNGDDNVFGAQYELELE